MERHYIGVDLHKAFFQACALDIAKAKFARARCWLLTARFAAARAASQYAGWRLRERLAGVACSASDVAARAMRVWRRPARTGRRLRDAG